MTNSHSEKQKGAIGAGSSQLPRVDSRLDIIRQGLPTWVLAITVLLVLLGFVFGLWFQVKYLWPNRNADFDVQGHLKLITKL